MKFKHKVNQNGIGLGMQVVTKVVAALKGEFTCESKEG
jgi:hypothetical protein